MRGANMKIGSCWTLLNKFITMHGPQNVNFGTESLSVLCAVTLRSLHAKGWIKRIFATLSMFILFTLELLIATAWPPPAPALMLLTQLRLHPGYWNYFNSILRCSVTSNPNCVGSHCMDVRYLGWGIVPVSWRYFMNRVLRGGEKWSRGSEQWGAASCEQAWASSSLDMSKGN